LGHLISRPLLPGEKGCEENQLLSPSPLGEGFRERWIRRMGIVNYIRNNENR
jgi:hypothetical protein